MERMVGHSWREGRCGLIGGRAGAERMREKTDKKLTPLNSSSIKLISIFFSKAQNPYFQTINRDFVKKNSQNNFFKTLKKIPARKMAICALCSGVYFYVLHS
jgi:hypothetical protein